MSSDILNTPINEKFSYLFRFEDSKARMISSVLRPAELKEKNLTHRRKGALRAIKKHFFRIFDSF